MSFVVDGSRAAAFSNSKNKDTELVEEKTEEVIEPKREESNVIAELEKKLKDSDDRLKRVAADYQNLLRRSQTELDDARKYSLFC